ncbi:2Fe-2S iron-sulfur cluster-binding protein [Nitrogeniibacter aestuarii]|uniref:2Fe-2S iron-sulfur cluster-binding protein n=1 Tax=Nitrogeniibacter aestuarii TaxID=2815343 RepID=UPI001E53B06F|nr:2Fe-2S iron-sulfur cluster-binding protein [Nitrogeniibacter aestuarii]
MAKITYIEADGTEHVVDIATGKTVMEGARDHNIAGILAECGGACACATCHAYIHHEWFDKLSPANPVEEDMLEFAVDTDPSRSRLTCQITVTDMLDGLIVQLPES